MKRLEKFVLFFLLFFLLYLRVYHLNVPPFEIEESWRQADTQSMAWNFANYDFNLLRPHLNYDGPFPNIPALEIQVTPFIIAILYKIFGQHYFLARIVPVLFFLTSGVFLYLFARLYMNWKGAAFSLLVYGIIPINVYYSRAIMPESGALMFWIGSLYFFNIWIISQEKDWKMEEVVCVRDESIEEQKIMINGQAGNGVINGARKEVRNGAIKKVRGQQTWLILSSLFLALAIMTKPPVVFVGLPMLYLCYKSFNWKWLRFPELWIYALFTLGVPAFYYYYSASMAEFKFTVGITKYIIFKDALTAFYSPEAMRFYSDNIPITLGYLGLLLLLPCLLALTKKQGVILVWFGSMLLEVIFIVSPIRATYYLIFLMVPCALLTGNLLGRIFYKSGGMILTAVLILAIAHESYYQIKPMYTINEIMQAQVQVVQELTTSEDLLIVGSFDPCLLSLADRRGWRYNLHIYSSVPEDPYDELHYYIASGAKYFVPIQGKVYGSDGDKLLKYIEEKYPKIEAISGYPIYVLQ